MKNRNIMDWPTFIGALLLLLIVAAPLAVFPEQGEAIVLAASSFLTQKFGILYLIMGAAVLIFILYVSFSRYGKIKLGDPLEKAEFSTLSWGAMLFCAGIGSSVLYWGTIEWAYYYTGPPFGIEPRSKEAVEWAAAYGIFHWGPTAWAIYCLPALPISYFYYVKKKPVLKVSEACRPLIGKKADGPIGKIIDVLFMFGLLGGAGTTLALGTPLITEGIHELSGIEPSMTLQTVVLLICTLIFAASAYSGLRKGIKILSDINLWLAVLLLVFVFLAGPTVFLAETAVNSIGIMLDHYMRMSLWTEPFNSLGPFERTGFPESWTVFYWAWWLVYAPFVGLFVAKISKGRTVREMTLGTVVYGTLGCILFFGILGNFGLFLELTGQYHVTATLDEHGGSAAIIGILKQLPLSNIVIAVFTVLAVIFLATTFDSSSYILASVVQKEVADEPLRWNRLFWAFALSVLPLILMYLGGLSTLQTVSIIGGFPLLFIFVLLAGSFIKAANQDFYSSKSQLFKMYPKKKGVKRNLLSK